MRDNTMQWDDSKNAGFTDGKPWMRVNSNYETINAAQQMTDEHSVFVFYQELIRLRKRYKVFVEGKFSLLCREHPEIFAYRRQSQEEKLIVICNFYGRKVQYPNPSDWKGKKLLLSNYEHSEESVLKPYEVRYYYQCCHD